MKCNTCGGKTRTLILFSSQEEGFCDSCGTNEAERVGSLARQLQEAMNNLVGQRYSSSVKDVIRQRVRKFLSKQGKMPWDPPGAEPAEDIDSHMDLHTLTGRELDNLGHFIINVNRHPGESDQEYRERLLEVLA